LNPQNGVVEVAISNAREARMEVLKDLCWLSRQAKDYRDGRLDDVGIVHAMEHVKGTVAEYYGQVTRATRMLAQCFTDQANWWNTVLDVWDTRVHSNETALAELPTQIVCLAMTVQQMKSYRQAQKELTGAINAYAPALDKTINVMQTTETWCNRVSLLALPLNLAIQGAGTVAREGLKAGLKCVAKQAAATAAVMGAVALGEFALTAAARAAGVNEQDIRIGMAVFNLLTLCEALKVGPYCFIAGTQILVAEEGATLSRAGSDGCGHGDRNTASYLIGALALGYAGRVLRLRRNRRKAGMHNIVTLL
jgi:hypothetical protein